MRNFKTEGIIIKRRNYKDADRILTVLTQTHGKIFVKAVGVRKITSRRAGHIELLTHGVFSLYQGHSYPVLTEATSINTFADIKADLRSIGHALHFCELIDALCPENQENIRVFRLLQSTLENLSLVCHPDQAKRVEGSQSVDFIEGDSSASLGMTKKFINEFEMQLLTDLGYWSKSNFQVAFDTESFIENIIERKLKARTIFSKLQ